MQPMWRARGERTAWRSITLRLIVCAGVLVASVASTACMARGTGAAKADSGDLRCRRPAARLVADGTPLEVWKRAFDPLLDFDQRYRLQFEFDSRPDDYPPGVEAAKLPPVRIYVTLLFDETGRVRDLRVDRFCSSSAAYVVFEREFAAAALQVFKKAKLLSDPYLFEGRRVPFTWPTLIVFQRHGK